MTTSDNETREPEPRRYEPPTITRFGTFAELTMVPYTCS